MERRNLAPRSSFPRPPRQRPSPVPLLLPATKLFQPFTSTLATPRGRRPSSSPRRHRRTPPSPSPSFSDFSRRTIDHRTPSFLAPPSPETQPPVSCATISCASTAAAGHSPPSPRLFTLLRTIEKHCHCPSMVKGKRNSCIVISSSDEDDNFPWKSGSRLSKSASTRSHTKRAKRVTNPNSCSELSPFSGSSDFDEVKRICEEFDQGFTQFKVTSGLRSNKDLWVEKFKPSCLEELAVHKKKVAEVKMWFEERLTKSVDNPCGNVILISGQAGVGKSATIYAIANSLGAEVHEWNTPTPTLWQEHLHNSNSGIRYTSKLDEFESFIERIRKYGLASSCLTRVSSSPIILLIDDLPVVNGKVSYGRLSTCLHLLLQSVCFPTAILINDYGRSESSEHHNRYWEDLQLSLQSAGARKVTFNPITVNSIKRVLSKICKVERFEVSDEKIDSIAKVSGGDIRHAIISLQYFCLSPHPMHFLSVPKTVSASPEERGNESGHWDYGVSLPFGKDATLSLFHALGKFLHNKRETGCLISQDKGSILLKEKFVRCPFKMDTPELVLCQAQGQARLITDFLHENVLDFVCDDGIEDAWVVGTYLSDADLLFASLSGTLTRNVESENVVQSTAASTAMRGVLFGNSCPVSSRWHAIRRPRLWQVEQSLWQNKCRMLSQTRDAPISTSPKDLAVLATEFEPALTWLRRRVAEDTESHKVLNKMNYPDGECHAASLDENYNEIDNDEIEDW